MANRKLTTFKTLATFKTGFNNLKGDELKPLPFADKVDGDTFDITLGDPAIGVVSSTNKKETRNYKQAVLITKTGEEIAVAPAICELVKPDTKVSIRIKEETIPYTKTAEDGSKSEEIFTLNKAIFLGLE